MERNLCYFVVIVFVVGLWLGPTEGAEKAEVYRLKVVSFVTRDNVMCGPLWNFRDLVHSKTKEVIIDYVGGPESIPGMEQDLAVSKGIVDMALVAPGYYQGRLPEVKSLMLSKLTPREERESGYFNFINELHNKVLNIQVLGRAQFPDAIRWLIRKKKIVDPKQDFKGLKIKGTSSVREWQEKALGIAYTMMPAAEIFTALDRGIVDGLSWGGGLGLCDYGWPKLCKYVIDEPNLCLAGNCLIVMNFDTWKRLPKRLGDLLMEVQIENEAWTKTFYEKERKNELDKMQEMGLEVTRFSPEDSKWFTEGANTYGWKDIEKTSPNTASKMKELLRVK